MRTIRLIAIVITLAMAAGGGLLSTSNPAAYAQDGTGPRWEPAVECFIELPESIDHGCGYVTVPEFYDRESSRIMKLGVVRLNAPSDSRENPLFMLMGGPGQSISTFLTFLPISIEAERSATDVLPGFARILENHDIVFMAQRGTQFTDTVLSCPPLASVAYTAYEQNLDEAATIALTTETLQGCIDDFEAAGINFNAYNNENNAADVNSVRAALGYDQIIYYGESYGAQLGQFVMRDYPEILEAVVLDGANPLSKTSWAQDRASSYQAALDNLTALCAEKPSCAQAHGDLGAVIDAATAQFDNGPLPYVYQDPTNPDIKVELELGLDDLAGFINNYWSFPGNMALPLLFQSVSEGKLDDMATLAAMSVLGSQGATSNLPILMQAAMICSDDPALSVSEADAEGVSALAAAYARGEAAATVALCAVMDVERLPDSSDVDVTLDVPTLLFSGALDTRTPPVRNQEVAEHLPNSRLVLFPMGSHVQVPNLPCANHILAAFVANPTSLADLDTTCIDEMDALWEFSTE